MKRPIRGLLTLLALALAGAALAGCAKGGGADPAKLQGTWKLESFGGAKALEPADNQVTTTLSFESGGKAGGKGGVNSFGTTYEASADGTLSFGDVQATLMAGSDNANAQEQQFFEALGKTKRFEFDGEKLVLSDKGNDTLAVLVKQ